MFVLIPRYNNNDDGDFPRYDSNGDFPRYDSNGDFPRYDNDGNHSPL